MASKQGMRVPWTRAEGQLHALAPGKALVQQAALRPEQVLVHGQLPGLEQAPKQALALEQCRCQQWPTALAQVPAHARALGQVHGQLAQGRAPWLAWAPTWVLGQVPELELQPALEPVLGPL